MNDKCTMCGQEGLVKLSSQNTKVCTGCGHEEAWPLEAGQQPLVGSHRQKSGTPVKDETVLDQDGQVVVNRSLSEPASLEELIGKPEQHVSASPLDNSAWRLAEEGAQMERNREQPIHDPIFRAIEVLGTHSHQSIMKRIDCLTDHKLNIFGRTLDRLLPRIAPEGSYFQEIQAQLRTLSDTIVATHTLYEKGDEGCPEQILDRNGDVVLGLCKHCGAGESELSQQVCTGPKPYKILEKGEQVYTGPQIIEFKMSTDTEANQALLRSYLSNLGLTQEAIISAAPSPQDTTPRPDPDYIRRSYRFADVCEANYLQLALVLQRAHDQAAYGKGKDRHANDLPFHEQRMLSISRLLDSPDGMAYQVLKKVTEGLELPSTERKVAKLLGAINYLAGIVIFLEAKDSASTVNIIAGEV